MSNRMYWASFGREDDLKAACRAYRKEGFEIHDAYLPYAVHGLDEAMGIRDSRLGMATLIFGLFGAALAMVFQYWTSAIDWAINVGGKPWNSAPTFVPVAFEMAVLLGGLGTVACFFILKRMYPGKAHKQPFKSITNDTFVVLLKEDGIGCVFDLELADQVSRAHNAVDTGEMEEAL